MNMVISLCMGVAELFLIMCGNLPIDKVGHCLLDFQLYICMDYNGLYMYGLERRHPTMGRLDEGI